MKRLAMGGMAEVWLAHQQGLGGFERLVVVKCILPHLESNARLVEMFLSEASTTASLNHPNLVDVINVHHVDGSAQIVMEYLVGLNLREMQSHLHKAGEALPPEIAMRVVADVADGLHYAHTAKNASGAPLKILHRDITPSNIMVTFNGVTKLLDFGLVAAAGALVSDPDRLSGYSAHVAYASPEQLHQTQMDPRSDVFSLGVVLHELLTGRRLFAAETSAGQIQALLEREIPAPSAVNPQVPRVFDAIVLTALQRDPLQRYASAGQLRDALHSCLADAQSVVSQARLSRWLQATLPEVYREKSAEERHAIREARASVDPFRSSSTLSVSHADFTPEDSAVTRISTMDTTADTHLERSASDGQALREPPAEPYRGLWVYAVGASIATLAVLAVMLAAYVMGRNAG